jgi:uncharacterized protein YjbI with pentapeptide repeats
MANEEQLGILKQGVEAWNAWREAHDIDIDLSGADFSRASLGREGAMLNGASLKRVNLGLARF